MIVHDQAESAFKSIFWIPEKVTPILNPQKAWLLADVFGL
jgi:hypothetical protein